MGRLEKKKTAVEKTKQRLKTKQKSEDNGNSIDSVNGGTLAKKPTFRPGSAKDTKIKLVQPAKKLPGASKISEISQGDNVISKSIEFLREVKVELNKVTWPTRQQTIASTVVVIILVIIMSLFLGLVDMSLSKIIEVLLH